MTDEYKTEEALEEEFVAEVPDIPEAAEDVLLFAIHEAQDLFAEKGELVPFSALLVKDQVLIETHPGESVEACFDDARHTVEGATGALAYAFCYDGFLDTEEGIEDALIAEGGIPGSSIGYAVGVRYTTKSRREDGAAEGVDFEEEVVYVGPADNFMEKLPAK